MRLEFLYRVFEQQGTDVSVIWKGEKYSYDALVGKIHKALSVIESDGIGPGSVVAVKGDFSPNAIALLFALIDKSCIVVPVTQSSSLNERTLFELAQVEYVVRIDEDDLLTPETCDRRSDNTYYRLIRERQHPGLVLFSSGTSGEPKAAVHDFEALLEKFRTRRPALRTVIFLSFDHWGGLNTMFHILSNGGVVVTPDDRNPESVCELIEEHKIELLPASPTFLNLMLLSGAYVGRDLDSLKVISYGTEPMAETTLRRLDRKSAV